MLTLSEDESGICVWSDRIDLTLEGWFDTQSRIVRRMAVALNLQVSSARMARLAQGSTYNPTPLFAAAVIYFLLMWPLVRLLSRFESRILVSRA